MLKSLSIIATVALVLSGCASTRNITPQYINPTTYQGHDCTYLQNEIARIKTLATKTENQQTTLSSSGIGIGLTGGRYGIFPSISIGLGTGSSNRNAKINTLSRLYGEHDAMIVTARQKNCAFVQGLQAYSEK